MESANSYSKLCLFFVKLLSLVAFVLSLICNIWAFEDYFSDKYYAVFPGALVILPYLLQLIACGYFLVYLFYSFSKVKLNRFFTIIFGLMALKFLIYVFLLLWGADFENFESIIALFMNLNFIMYPSSFIVLFAAFFVVFKGFTNKVLLTLLIMLATIAQSINFYNDLEYLKHLSTGDNIGLFSEFFGLILLYAALLIFELGYHKPLRESE